MNQSITELEDLIGDGNNSISLTDINNSITSLENQINRIKYLIIQMI
jgi:hypothetical protein